MKQVKNKQLIILAGYLLFSTFFIACSSGNQINSVFSQDEIARAINDNRWDFSADYAMPSYGRSRNITGSYYVKCRKDTLIVALPYYGKVEGSIGINSGNPLDFQSTDFKLTKEDKKGGGWLVTIKPSNSEVQSMTFTFFDNGSAQANCIMTNRSGINFSGKVAPAR